MTPQSVQFTALPENILEEIISHLKVRDINNLLECSKKLSTRLREVQIKWKVPKFIQTNINQCESSGAADDRISNCDELNRFIDRVADRDFWSVNHIVIFYKVYGAESIMNARHEGTTSKCICLDGKFIRNIQKAVKNERVSLEINIKDERMCLYRGDLLKLNLDLTDLLLSTASLKYLEIKVDPKSAGVTGICQIESSMRPLLVSSSLETFSAPCPSIMCNMEFIRQLTRLCPNLKSLKIPKKGKALDFM